MPRDATPQSLGEIDLPAGRKGRVVETLTAGVFRIQTAGSWVDRLHQAGHLDRDECDAALALALAFENAGIRPKLTGGYDGGTVDGAAYDGGLLETLNRSEMLAWRRCNKLLSVVPRRLRSQVQAVVLWDCEPWDIRALQRGLAVLAAVALHRR